MKGTLWLETKDIRIIMAPWMHAVACSGNQWRCQHQVIAVKTIHMRLEPNISSKIAMKLTLGQERGRIAQGLRFVRTLLKYSLDHPGPADTMKMVKENSSLLGVLEPQVAKVEPLHAVISVRIVPSNRPST